MFSALASYLPLLLIAGLALTGFEIKHPGEAASMVSVSPDRVLQWDDFKVVKVIQGKSSINAICLSTCDVKILKVIPRGNNVSLTVNAIVNFEKELSQVTESFLANNDAATKAQVLHHENGHFLIAQIIAHRIVKDTKDRLFDAKNYKVELNRIISTHFRSWNQMDQLYDLECTKPRNPVMQKKWDTYFQKELDKYNASTK